MADLTYRLDDADNPLFKLPAALQGRRLAVSTESDVVHPIRALATGASKFAASFQNAVDMLNASDFYTAETESASPPVLTAFESLCYNVTEFFDLFTLDLAKAMNLKGDKKAKERFNDYKGIVSKRRDVWATICNKIKHNHNVLVPFRKTYNSDGLSVRGYALYQPVAQNQQFINRSFHKAGEAFRSFDLSLQQMVYDVLKCDIAAANLISQLPDDVTVSPLAAPEIPFRIGAQLQALSIRTVYAGDREQVMFDGFEIEGKSLKLIRKRALDRKGAANEVSAIFSSDEVINHFEFE